MALSPTHVDCEHVDCEHVDCEHVDCEHVDCEHVDCEHVIGTLSGWRISVFTFVYCFVLEASS